MRIAIRASIGATERSLIVRPSEALSLSISAVQRRSMAGMAARAMATAAPKEYQARVKLSRSSWPKLRSETPIRTMAQIAANAPMVLSLRSTLKWELGSAGNLPRASVAGSRDTGRSSVALDARRVSARAKHATAITSGAAAHLMSSVRMK